MMPRRMIPTAMTALLLVISLLPNTPLADASGGSFGGGDGSAADPYVIEDVWDLQNMSGDRYAHYVLGNDINASATREWDSGAGFTPVGNGTAAFHGSLDGRNRTITGLYINRSGEDGVGLFGFLTSGYAANLRLEDVNVTGSEGVGALGGNFWGASNTISNIHVTGNVSGGSNVGGLVGYLLDTDVRDCHFHGPAVSGAWKVGGLAGVLGRGTMTDCSAEGTVTGDEDVGGLVGLHNSGAVRTSFATADVAGSRSVGGLFGYMQNSNVNDSYANGSVTGTSRYAGGLVGYSNQGYVANSYAAGSVTGVSDVGGLVGYKTFYGASTNSFYDTQTTGQTASAGGSGNTTSEMRTRSTFTDVDWDFDMTWFIIENVTYPLLRWQDARPPTADAGPDQTVDEGALVTFDGSGSLDDLWIADYTWTLTDGTLVTLEGAQPSHRFEDPGTFVVTLNVTDATGKWDTDGMTVTVNDTTPPVADAGPDQTVDDGDWVLFDGRKSSDNVGVARYNWTFTVTDNVTLSGSMPSYRFDVPGVFVVTLNVTDAAGNWDTDDMTVTVRDTDPPTANAGPDQTVDEWAWVTFDGSGSLDDVGVMSYTWTFTDGTLVTLHGTNPTYWFKNQGLFIVTLKVTDAAGNWATDTMTVTVRQVADPVFFQTRRLDNATQGVPYSFLLSVNESLWTDLITFTLETVAGWLSLNATSLELSGTPGPRDVGVVWVNVTAEDGHNFRATGNWHLTVLNVNDPPAILTNDVVTTDEDAAYRVEYHASDPDAGDTLVWSLDTDAAWLGIEAATGVLSGLPTNDDVGTYTVNVTVTDGSDASASHEFALTVINVNDAPDITSTLPPLLEALEDETFRLTLRAIDVDDAALTWSDDTDLFEIGPTNGTIAFLPTQADVGEWWVNVTVVDPGGLMDTVSIWFVVVNVNDAPVITALEPANGTTFKHDALITLSAQAEDEDGDELTLTWRDGDRVLGIGATLEVRLAPGEHGVVLTVSDGTEEVEDSTVITVLERKDAPGPSILPGLLIIAIIIVIIALLMTWRSRWRKRAAGPK